MVHKLLLFRICIMNHRNDGVSENLSSSKLADYSMRFSLSLHDFLEARCPRGDASCVQNAIFFDNFLILALVVHVFLTIIVEAESCMLVG